MSKNRALLSNVFDIRTYAPWYSGICMVGQFHKIIHDNPINAFPFLLRDTQSILWRKFGQKALTGFGRRYLCHQPGHLCNNFLGIARILSNHFAIIWTPMPGTPYLFKSVFFQNFPYVLHPFRLAFPAAHSPIKVFFRMLLLATTTSQ